MQRIIRLFASSLLLGAAVLNVEAHEPFDCSSRVTVKQDEIHVEVMMGLDGVRVILPAAGFSPEQIKNIVLMRHSRDAIDLPAAFSARLFEVNVGGKELAAKVVKAHCDGMEVVFASIYPRPAEGVLNLRAAYFDVAKDMSSGSLVAHDELRNQLGWALLSPASPSAQIKLPALRTNGNAGSNSITNATSPSAEPEGKIIQQGTPTLRNSFAQFFKLGVEHILTGFDHLVFLVALLIGARKPMAVLCIVTCFTLAHSLTLALAALNMVTIPARIIEPLIAASIIAVGIENLVRPNALSDRYWLAGGFGLLHGFGFADALRQTGLGREGGAMAVPLLSFNVGVEVGQLAVVAVFVPLLLGLRHVSVFERHGSRAVSCIVILLGGFWFIQRLVF